MISTIYSNKSNSLQRVIIMKNNYEYKQQKQRLINYIKNGEKKENNFKIGLEIEHFILERDDLSAVPYFGDRGIETILRGLTGGDWEEVYEGDYLLGLKGKTGNISLEPGGQIEFSSFPYNDITSIGEVYRDFLERLKPILSYYKMVLVNTGYQPVSRISDIPLLPKKRYKYMYDYFKDKGRYAHHMMKGTASIQVNLDYHDEEDYNKKIRVASYLAPLVYTYFDNAPFFEGSIRHKGNVRFRIWDNCDNERCGLVKGVFRSSYSYCNYAEYILNTPAIITTVDGDLIYSGKKKVREIFDPVSSDDKQIAHFLSMVFPDVRIKNHLEIRTGDSLPFSYSLAYIAFWKGLLYDHENLSLLAEELDELSAIEKNQQREIIKNQGLEGFFNGITVLDKMKELTSMASQGLPEKEKQFLQPLNGMLNKGLNPRLRCLSSVGNAKKEALSWCLLK